MPRQSSSWGRLERSVRVRGKASNTLPSKVRFCLLLDGLTAPEMEPPVRSYAQTYSAMRGMAARISDKRPSAREPNAVDIRKFLLSITPQDWTTLEEWPVHNRTKYAERIMSHLERWTAPPLAAGIRPRNVSFSPSSPFRPRRCRKRAYARSTASRLLPARRKLVPRTGRRQGSDADPLFKMERHLQDQYERTTPGAAKSLV